jgi:hypothetical protein
VDEERESTQASGSAPEETIARRPDSADVLEAIQDLSARVGGIQAELNALRGQTRPLPEEGAAEAPGWNGRSDHSRETFAWVRELEGPRSRAARVPWLLLEITFLAAVAVGLAVANVRWEAIAAVMAGAWVLVALAEWTAARAARRRAEAAYAPVPVYGEALASDPSWFAPPSERTVLDARDEDTGTRLPPPTAA